MPNLAMITAVGDLISAETELTIHYTDYSSVTVKTVLTRATGDDAPKLKI